MLKKTFLLIIVSMVFFVSSLSASEVSVMRLDGTVEIGSLKAADEQTITLSKGVEELTIPSDAISLIYFLGTNRVYTSGNIIPKEILGKREYIYKGDTYTVGVIDGDTVVYGPTGEQITDQIIVSEFKKIEVRLSQLLQDFIPDNFEGYIEIIDDKITSRKVQNAAATIRDFSAGVAINSLVVLINSGAVAKIAIDAAFDATEEALKSMVDPENYLIGLAEMNLNFCKTELTSLLEDLEDIKQSDQDGSPRDLFQCLDVIGRYLTVFTVYQPSIDLLKEMTASGNLKDQLDEVRKSVALKLGSMALDKANKTGDIISYITMANNAYAAIKPYKDYETQLKASYKSLKEDMPFYSEEVAVMNYAENIGGIRFDSNVSWLENYKDKEKFDEMLKKITDNPFTSNDIYNGDYSLLYPFKGDENLEQLNYIKLKAGGIVPIKAFLGIESSSYGVDMYGENFYQYIGEGDFKKISISEFTIKRMINTDILSEQSDSYQKWEIYFRNGTMETLFLYSYPHPLKYRTKTINPYNGKEIIVLYNIKEGIKEIVFGNE